MRKQVVTPLTVHETSQPLFFATANIQGALSVKKS